MNSAAMAAVMEVSVALVDGGGGGGDELSVGNVTGMERCIGGDDDDEGDDDDKD